MGDLVPIDSPFLPDDSPLSGDWTSLGGSVPLFDLLTTQLSTSSKTPAASRVFSKEELRASIIYEIQLLLNARVKIPLALYTQILETNHTTGFPELYGIPDFSAFDASDMGTWALYADYIKNAIITYEPRLINVDVTFEKFEASSQVILAYLSGDVIYQSMIEPFSFSVKISKSS